MEKSVALAEENMNLQGKIGGIQTMFYLQSQKLYA